MFVLDQQIVDWLRSLGYPVAEMPRESVAAMFFREARKWGLSPRDLAMLVKEADAVLPGIVGSGAVSFEAA